MLAFLWPEDGIECRDLDHFTCREGMHGSNVTLVGTKKRKTIRRKQHVQVVFIQHARSNPILKYSCKARGRPILLNQLCKEGFSGC